MEIREPDRVIGTNTISNIQSGLFYGAVDAVDGMLDRLCAVLGKQTKVIATGGQAPLVAGASKYKPTIDSSLTLDGLRIIYHRNHPDRESRYQVSGVRYQEGNTPGEAR